MPISLLIMSRAFTLQAPDPARALAQSISAMDEDVVTEVSGTAFRRCVHKYGVTQDYTFLRAKMLAMSYAQCIDV